MKKLVFEPFLLKKLDRLEKKATSLNYIGANPNELLHNPTVAIVGTRKMSPYGLKVTEMLATELARAGVTIVSGNALGVDVHAQRCALLAGGKVVAVVPSGLDSIYPATNSSVADDIIKQGGAIISEYEPGHRPRPHEFLDRNRIIAALSDAVIIPEANERSGSLNTARHALEMGVPLFAVPGPITNNLSSGTNALLKHGALVITSPKDVFELLHISKQQTQQSLLGSNEQETVVLQAIASGVQDTTMLANELHIDITELQTILTMLEIDGHIEQDAVGAWQKV